MREGDLVLCKVEDVSNTVVFVRLPDGRKGTIISSEIAPGRIKYMQKYVVPNKEIVCKVLSVSGDSIHLSLRRVSAKEKTEVLRAHKQEKAFNLALDQLLGEKAKEVKDKILRDFESLSEFFEASRQDPSLLGKYVPESVLEPIRNLVEKQRKRFSLRYVIEISSKESDGISRIKSVLSFDDARLSISYLAAGKFLFKFDVKDFKQGKRDAAELLEVIENRAKEKNCEIRIREEK